MSHIVNKNFMKKLFLLSMMLLLVTRIWAQNITGTVVNEKLSPVSFANISLLRADSSFVSGAKTDVRGVFRILKTAGAKFLKISCVGYQTKIVACDSIVMGNIILKNEVKTLGEVEVISQQQLIKQEADKLSYAVEKDPDAATVTVMEMLRKVPLVAVDGQDNITVKGSSTFKIYKNGHPDASLSTNPKEVLKAIPANMIKRIEVITEPGAKYDAEGATAILNIVMKENSQIKGVTATVTARSSSRKGAMASTYLAAQIGKLVVSADYTFSRQSKKQTLYGNESTQYFEKTGNSLAVNSQGTNAGNVHFANVMASYDVDSLNLMTLSADGYGYTFDLNRTSNTSKTDADGHLLYRYESDYRSPGYSFANWNGRFDYEHRTHLKDEVFTFSYMLSTTKYTTSSNTAYSDMINMPVSYSGYAQNGRERFYEHTLQADYVRPISKFHKIEMGTKYICRLNKSHTMIAYNGAANNVDRRFDHSTQVAAAYLSYMFTKDKWSARAGLRYEYSYLDARYPDGTDTDFHRHLNDWVPSASITYRMSAANSLKANYATSINRPGISYLNPAVISTPTSVSYGNSNLSSSRNTSFGITFMHIGSKITWHLNPFYEFADNRISSMRFAKHDVVYSTYGNILRYRKVGFSFYTRWQATKTTTLMLNSSLNYLYNNNPNEGLTMHKWYDETYANLSQKLPLGLQLGVYAGGILGHQVSGVYGYNDGYRYHGVSLHRSFFKEDRLTVRLVASDVLDGNRIHYRTFTTQGDYTGHTCSYYPGATVSVSISYRIGKLKGQVKKTEKTIDNNDVVGGLSRNADK